MPIIVNLDVMMAQRKMSLSELAEQVDITLSNLSILKTGKAKAIRFSTLQKIFEALDCQPADILEYNSFFTYLNQQDAKEFSNNAMITSGIAIRV
jgi:putative transcriptional regulator